MKKRTVFALLYAIFLIIFNLVYFLVGGFNHSTAVWLSYGFITFAYVMLVVTPYVTYKRLSFDFLSGTVWIVSLLYFLLEFTAGMRFKIILTDVKLAAIVHMGLLACYAIVLLLLIIFNKRTIEEVKRHAIEVDFIKTAASKIKSLISLTNDERIIDELEKLSDLIYSSPTKSCNEVKLAEEKILELADELEKAIAPDPLAIIREIKITVEKRNSVLKLSQNKVE